MADTPTTYASAVVTLEIPVPGGTWNRGCTLEEVYKQARRDAETEIRNKLGIHATIKDVAIRAIIVPEK